MPIATSAVVSSVNWTEKYRPKELKDVGLDDENRALLEAYLERQEIPHLLFVGPAGAGKTSVSRILIDHLNCAVLPLNASTDRGIDVVREKIGQFAGSMGMAEWNIVFLDEFDQMTTDAQTALRNMMEVYSDKTRFILTGNYAYKIIAPIQSRCQVVVLGAPPLKERFRILSRVLQSEGVQVDAPTTTFGYAERYPDLRRMLWAAQKAVLANKGTLPPVATSGPISGPDLWNALLAKDWRKFISLTQSGEFDCLQLFRELFWAIPDGHPKAFPLRHMVGEGAHETGFTPDPILLFLSVISNAIDVL